MEERKTAAWLLGAISIAVIFYMVIWPWVQYKSSQTISFGKCTAHFKYTDKETAQDVYRTSQNKLGLCLCSLYKQRPDTSVGNHIAQIYRLYADHCAGDTLHIGSNVDSIIKYKNKVLDTIVLVD